MDSPEHNSTHLCVSMSRILSHWQTNKFKNILLPVTAQRVATNVEAAPSSLSELVARTRRTHLVRLGGLGFAPQPPSVTISPSLFSFRFKRNTLNVCGAAVTRRLEGATTIVFTSHSMWVTVFPAGSVQASLCYSYLRVALRSVFVRYRLLAPLSTRCCPSRSVMGTTSRPPTRRKHHTTINDTQHYCTMRVVMNTPPPALFIPQHPAGFVPLPVV